MATKETPEQIAARIREQGGGRTQRGPQCVLCKAFDEMDDATRTVALEVLDDDDGFTRKGVAMFVAEVAGAKVTPDTVGRHRKGECVTFQRLDS